MKDYLRIPTHKKYGFLVWIGLFIVSGIIASFILGENHPLYGLVGLFQMAVTVALLIEVIASLLGKNKPN